MTKMKTSRYPMASRLVSLLKLSPLMSLKLLEANGTAAIASSVKLSVRSMNIFSKAMASGGSGPSKSPPSP